MDDGGPCEESALTEAWSRTESNGRYEGAADVATDASGNVAVVGRDVTGYADVSDDPITDSWIREYDPDGNVLWTATAGEPGTQDGAWAVAIDDEGKVIAIASSSDGTGWIGAYSPDGEPSWSHKISESMGDIATDGTDALVLVASEVHQLRRYDGAGAEVWTIDLPALGSTLAVANGETFVLGRVSDERPHRTWLGRFDRDQALVWERIGEPDDAAHLGVAALGGGSALVGERLGDDRYVVRRVDDESTESILADETVTVFDRVGALAASVEGDFAVFGTTAGDGPALESDGWVQVYDGAGCPPTSFVIAGVLDAASVAPTEAGWALGGTSGVDPLLAWVARYVR